MSAMRRLALAGSVRWYGRRPRHRARRRSWSLLLVLLVAALAVAALAVAARHLR